jgi:hypothetical protein
MRKILKHSIDILILVLKMLMCPIYYIGKLFVIFITQCIPQLITELWYQCKYGYKIPNEPYWSAINLTKFSTLKMWYIFMKVFSAKSYFKSNKWYYGY